MEKIIMTCPFTGIDFEAVKYADGRIVARHAITGNEVVMKWNNGVGKYNLEKSAFDRIKTVTFTQAAEILEVTPQRVTQIVKKGIINPASVKGGNVLLLSDVLKYKETRKVGAPKKEK